MQRQKCRLMSDDWVIEGHPHWDDGISRNPERIVVIMYNIDIISETYEDMASGKLQIRRFQPPHSGLTTVISETLLNI